MSDTPRTDEAIWDEHDPAAAVGHLCHELERDLTAARERIKRLEEAGDRAILNSYLPDRLSAWTAAKEAKL